jgi:signal peptidase II
MIYAASAAALVIIADRLAKSLVLERLYDGQSVEVIPKVFHLTLVFNTGAAFGILKGSNGLFTAASVAVIAFIMIYVAAGRRKDAVMNCALGLILGGAAGNLIDRIMFGSIIDFLDLRVWPVFNVADSAITAGSALIVIRIFSGRTCSTR